MIADCRTVSLPVSIGSLLLALCVAPGCGTAKKTAKADNMSETGSAGVTVTKEVPHSKETLSETRHREMTNPLPARGDKAIRSHRIPRAGNDDCETTE